MVSLLLSLKKCFKSEKCLLLLFSFAYFSILLLTSLNTSCTMDEGTYTGVGYRYITEGRLDLNPEHPPLAKYLIGLGEFLYEDLFEAPHEWHKHLPSLLLPYRLPIMILSVLLGIIVYKWSKELWGVKGGIVSLILFYFSPNIIANSTIATIDLTSTFFVFTSMYFLWKFFKGYKRVCLVDRIQKTNRYLLYFSF